MAKVFVKVAEISRVPLHKAVEINGDDVVGRDVADVSAAEGVGRGVAIDAGVREEPARREIPATFRGRFEVLVKPATLRSRKTLRELEILSGKCEFHRVSYGTTMSASGDLQMSRG